MKYAYSVRLDYVPNSASVVAPTDVAKRLNSLAGADLTVETLGIFIRDTTLPYRRERLATTASFYEVDGVVLCADYQHRLRHLVGNRNQRALLLLRTAFAKELHGKDVYVLGRHPNAKTDLPLCGYVQVADLRNVPTVLQPFTADYSVYRYDPENGLSALPWLLNWLATPKTVSLGAVIGTVSELHIDLRIASDASDLRRALSY